MLPEGLIPLAVAIPLGAGFLLPLVPRKAKRLADGLAVVAAGALGVVVIALFRLLRSGAGKTVIYAIGGWKPPIGISMVLDGLSWLMLAMIAGISFCAILYSTQYMDAYTARGKYYGLFFIMVAGMCGVVLTGDLFNMYVFLEVAAISSYALVAFGCEAEELEASFKYSVLGATASFLVIFALALLYGQFGTVNFAHLSQSIYRSMHDADALVLFAEILLVVGFSLKAALFPFHAWLPDAHSSAPSPISAMLSGVLIKAVGVYSLSRLVFNVFGLKPGISEALVLLATVSMIGGVLLAVMQWDFKRLLAYHSISQIGYVVLGIGLGTPLGVMAGLFHLLNHSAFKSLLFLNAGAVEQATGTRRLDEMGGLAEQMPMTGGTSLVASMSIAGLPPFNGFFSKTLVILACVEAGRYGLALVAVIASVLTLASFLKVQRYGFFGSVSEKWKHVKEAPILMSATMFVLAVACLGLSLLVVPGIRDAVLVPAGQALLSGASGAASLVLMP